MTDKPVREAGVKNAHAHTSNVNPSFTAGYNARQPEVDQLRAENKILRLRGDTFFEACNKANAESERLREENERLRGLLKHLIGEAQDRDDIAQMDEIYAALATGAETVQRHR